MLAIHVSKETIAMTTLSMSQSDLHRTDQSLLASPVNSTNPRTVRSDQSYPGVLMTFSGSIQGNKNCGTNQNLGPSKVHQCPMYANSACFIAHSYHIDYTQDPLTGDTFTEDYRGCSPFTDHYGNVGLGRHCEQIDFNGFAHENCKGTFHHNKAGLFKRFYSRTLLLPKM